RTHSRLFYVHLELDVGATVEPPGDYSERAAFVVRGRIGIGGTTSVAGDMVALAPGETVLPVLEPSTVMLLGGEPLGQRHIWWNFVSSRRERIEQAKADWRAGERALSDGDARQRI